MNAELTVLVTARAAAAFAAAGLRAFPGFFGCSGEPGFELL
jgi:hypothetical protein